MHNKIKHDAIVEEFKDGCLKVKIIQASACAVCKAASHCHASESKEKIVSVYGVSESDGFSKGDQVTVWASMETGRNAVLLAFVLPFVLMVSVVFLMSRFTTEEPLMALSGVGILVPYYILLYMFRDRISNRFSFKVEKYH